MWTIMWQSWRSNRRQLKCRITVWISSSNVNTTYGSLIAEYLQNKGQLRNCKPDCRFYQLSLNFLLAWSQHDVTKVPCLPQDFRSSSTISSEPVFKMNAIIALCHFCEFHGPSVLFCTQVTVLYNSQVQLVNAHVLVSLVDVPFSPIY